MNNYIFAAIAFKGAIFLAASVAQFLMVVAVVMKGVKEKRTAKCIAWLGASCVLAGLTLFFMGLDDFYRVYLELTKGAAPLWKA